MKSRLFLLTATLLIAMVAGFGTASAGPSIEEVNAKVADLWKPLQAGQKKVTAVEFKKIMDSDASLVLLDIRTEEEFAAAHLPGAMNISRGLLEWIAPKKITDTDARIFVYCKTGARATFAVQRLTEMGYTNVTNITDSFKGWVEAGYPVYNRHGEFVLATGGFEKKE